MESNTFVRKFARHKIKKIKKCIRHDLREYSIIEVARKRDKIFFFLIKYIPLLDIVFRKSVFTYIIFKKMGILFKEFESNLEKSKIIKKLLKDNRKKFIVFSTPLHGNLGDRALLVGEKRFVEQYFPGYSFCAIPLEYLSAFIHCKKYIRKEDIIALHAGGNIGSLYPCIHIMQEKVVQLLKKKTIMIFPQTFYYSKDDDGRKCLANTRRVYRKCKKQHIFVRDKGSFQFVRQELPFARVDLMPDMALMLLGRKNQTVLRQGALICLRNDSERTMSVQEWDEILEFAQNQFGHLEQADTHVYHDMADEQARDEIEKLLIKMESVKIVITDRLHGMIFSLITKTPCVVVASKSHKVEGVYDWIKSNEYIQMISCIRDLPFAAKKAVNADNTVVKRDVLYSYFEQMAKIIKEKTQRDQ